MEVIVNPKLKLLTVKSERLQAFNEKIKFGDWYDLFDKDGNLLIWIQINKINDGEEYQINIEGFDGDDPDAPEDYDVSDLIHCYTASVI